MAKSQTTKNTLKSGMSTKDYEIKIEDTYRKGFENGLEHGREEMYKKMSKALKEYKKRQKLINEIMIRGGIR